MSDPKRGLEHPEVARRRSLLPEMERLGVATSAQVDLDTLLDRTLAEAVASDSIVVGHLQVGAWCVVREA